MDAETKALLTKFRLGSKALSGKAADELEALARDVDFTDFNIAQEALVQIYAGVVLKYCPASSGLAVGVYGALRDLSSAKGTFSAVPALNVSSTQVLKDVSWATESLWKARDVEACISTLKGSTIESVMNAGRDTMAENAVADRKETKSRVGFGIDAAPDACDFCLQKDTGGEFPYRSTDTAEATFHRWCGCAVTVGWE